MPSRITRREFLRRMELLLLASLLSKRTVQGKPLINSQYNMGGAAKSEQRGTEMDDASPNVLVMVFDALAAQHVSVYGYRRDTTPNLAKFAEQAIVYHAHYAGGNFTPPGTASLLTGTYPWTNRAFNHGGTVAHHLSHQNLFRAFDKGTHTKIAYTQNLWADLLLNQFKPDVDNLVDPGEFCLIDGQFYDRLFPRDLNAAYRSFGELVFPSVAQRSTSLFLGIAENARMAAYRKSLKAYAAQFPRGVPELWKLFFILEHAIDGMLSLVKNTSQPFLGYFHVLPPHDPYNTRHDFVDCFDDGWTPEAKPAHFFSQGHADEYLNHQRREYDEYIAYADAEFGRLLDGLEKADLLQNTYVVVTSDHGEMFERGILAHQTQTLYDPVIRVPLLIHKPGQQSREDVHVPTSCVDLVPTLAKVTGHAIPNWCEGEVLPKMGEEQSDSERSIFAVEAKSNAKPSPLTKRTIALIKGQYKLIDYAGYSGYEDQVELYDLQNDPEELNNLSLTHSSIAADFKNEIKEKLKETES